VLSMRRRHFGEIIGGKFDLASQAATRHSGTGEEGTTGPAGGRLVFTNSLIPIYTQLTLFNLTVLSTVYI
jgi:hypothetical protein